MSKLSIADGDLIKSLRAADVLQDVEEHLLDQKNGVILVTCSDADRFDDIFEHQKKMQLHQRNDVRAHVLSWNGGALTCAPRSPVNIKKRADKIFIEQIKSAREMKDIDLVVLLAHAPCGAAGKIKLTIEGSLWLQIAAKKEIKSLNEGIKVALFFHVDYDNGKKRTYFLSREKWDAWWHSHR